MPEQTVRRILTLSEARELARREGAASWKRYIPQDCSDCLSERYLEAEHCWFFFRNPVIVVPDENWFAYAYSAIAVSKLGDVRSIKDFSHEPEKLTDYLNLMSAYFAHRERGGPKPVLPDWMHPKKTK
jgi:hypothetical protein